VPQVRTGSLFTKRWATALLIVLLTAAGTSTGRLLAEEVDDQYAVAAGLYARQQWQLAAEEFEAFLEKFPDHGQAAAATYYLGEAYLQQGQLEAAGNRFRQYLKRQPNSKLARSALFRAGESAYLLGDVRRAEAELEQFRHQYPDDPLGAYVLNYLGNMALARQDAASAVGLFRDALGRFPDGPLAVEDRFGLAESLEKQGNKKEAAELYRAVAAEADGSLADDAQFRLGTLLYALGRYAEAARTLAAFETSLATSPFQAHARLGHAWALRKLKQFDEAKAMLRTISSDAKIGLEAQYWLGIIQREQGNWQAAAETLQASAEAAPADHKLLPAMRYFAGDALLRQGRYEAAVGQFDRLLALEGSASMPSKEALFDDALLGKLQAAVETGDHAAADRLAAQFERQYPDSPLITDVRRRLAQSLLNRKQYEQASRLLDPLVVAGLVDQQGQQDRYLLALAHKGQKRYDEALAVLLPVIDAAEGSLLADAQHAHGSLLLAKGQYAEAVVPLEAYLRSGPEGDEKIRALGELAIGYARTDRLDKAKTIYQTLQKRYPDHPVFRPLIEQLAEAAYDAKDTQWSGELFDRLRADSDEAAQWKGLSGLGWSQFKAGQFAEAADTFEQVLAANPPAEVVVETAMVRAQALEKLDRPDDALAMYALVIDDHRPSEHHSEAMLAAARLNDRIGRDREAAALYERLAREYPDLPDADTVLYEWAWVLRDLEQPGESAAMFERLRNDYPDSRYRDDVTYRLAHHAFYAEKNLPKAISLVDALLAGTRDARIREHTLNLRGQIAVEKQDWSAVRETYAAFLREFPNSTRRPIAEFWIAESLCREKKYEAADQRLAALQQQTADSREPWVAQVWLRRAQVLGHLGRWDEAHDVAKQIADRWPGFPQQYEADFVIGRALALRAELDAAREAYRRVINSPSGAKTVTAAMAQWMVGETYFHQKNYEAALREYLRVEILYDYPVWQAGALLQAAKCREQLGEWNEAVALYNRVVKEYPSTPFADRAKQRLSSAQGTSPTSLPRD